MRKYLIVALLLLTIAGGLFAADQMSGTSVTIASVVTPPEPVNPSIIIGIGSTELSYYMSPDMETTAITGINLMEDGEFSFALMTSEEVRIPRGTSIRSFLDIEVKAEGFHLYDYNYTGFLEGSSMDESNIKRRDAVPLLSENPKIEINSFFGTDENVEVYYTSGKNSKITIEFREGVTKANLILGTFKVQWKGQRPLEAGIYKAKVSIIYSSP